MPVLSLSVKQIDFEVADLGAFNGRLTARLSNGVEIPGMMKKDRLRSLAQGLRRVPESLVGHCRSGQIPLDFQSSVKHADDVDPASPFYEVCDAVVPVKQQTNLTFWFCPIFVSDLRKCG